MGASGLVGLQNHADAGRVWFRNIQVREVPEETVGPTPTASATTEPTTEPTTGPPATPVPSGQALAPPDTSISGGPSGFVRRTAARFVLTASQDASFECRLDTTPWSTCSSAVAFAGLRRAQHTLWARAVGTAGLDATPAARTWTIDRRAPRVKVLEGLDPTRDLTPRIRASVVDRVAGFRKREVRLFIDGRRVTALRWRGRTMSTTARSVDPGDHRVRLVVRDRAGNVTRLRWQLIIRT